MNTESAAQSVIQLCLTAVTRYGGAVFGHHNSGLPIPLIDPVQQFAEALGNNAQSVALRSRSGIASSFTSSKEKIEPAKEAWRRGDWQNGMFQLPVDNQDEIARAPEE